jgi:hypothetical protein
MNIQLLVGGIIWNLQKAFDCVDLDISDYLLKLYGISDKNHALYHSYLDNRHCRTAKYNDSENSNKVSS